MIYKHFRSFCFYIVYSYFPDYEKAGILHCVKVVRFLVDIISTGFFLLTSIGQVWVTTPYVEIGLWQYCFSRDEECVMYSEETLTLSGKAVRVMVALSCLCMLAATAFSVFGLFSSKTRGTFHSIATVSACCCLACALIIFTVQANSTSPSPLLEIKEQNFRFGWTYIVGWTSVCFTFIAWVIVFCSVTALNEIWRKQKLKNRDKKEISGGFCWIGFPTKTL